MTKGAAGAGTSTFKAAGMTPVQTDIFDRGTAAQASSERTIAAIKTLSGCHILRVFVSSAKRGLPIAVIGKNVSGHRTVISARLTLLPYLECVLG